MPEPISELGLPKGPTVFPPTNWALLGRARENGGADARLAREEICRLYWLPLYVFLRRKGIRSAEAQDLTQGLMTHLLAGDFLARIEPWKGKFTSLLLASLENFLRNDRAHRGRLKRGGGRLFSLEALRAVGGYRAEPAHHLTPSRLFERQLALDLLDRAAGRVQEVFASSGKVSLFDDLQFCLTGDQQPFPYVELARRAGKSKGAIKVIIHRMRKRFGDFLLEEIACTVGGPEEVEERLDDLREVLGQPPPRTC